MKLVLKSSTVVVVVVDEVAPPIAVKVGLFAVVLYNFGMPFKTGHDCAFTVYFMPTSKGFKMSSSTSKSVLYFCPI